MNPANNPLLHPLKGTPSGMDNDPNADEEIIDQTTPRPSQEETDLTPADGTGRIPSQVAPDPTDDDDLGSKIAYALDGSESTPLGEPTVGKVTHSGMTGASLQDEEANARD
ncbi:hypothetical protein [Tellurirhabdus rosea]|uniref:hypothetical protein n=1 Tax=Tellurirhabdus rosea TaxID=2674997 RepID=UPI0022574BC9|nr:hypothetical protein [Tellurirhabdus rosea]